MKIPLEDLKTIAEKGFNLSSNDYKSIEQCDILNTKLLELSDVLTTIIIQLCVDDYILLFIMENGDVFARKPNPISPLDETFLLVHNQNMIYKIALKYKFLSDYENISPIIHYAIECHLNSNHFYSNGNPYYFHLQNTYDYGLKYSYLLDTCDIPNCLYACWCHDILEDTTINYNELVKNTNTTIADIVYNVTNEKGKNRYQRAGKKYYTKIRKDKNSIFVKICDRLANISQSVKSNSLKLKMYKSEYKEFKKYLYDEDYNDMFIEIEELLGLAENLK